MFVYLNSLQSSWSRENVESSTENCTEMALCRKFMENSVEHSWPQSWKKNMEHTSWEFMKTSCKNMENIMEQHGTIMKNHETSWTHHEQNMEKPWKKTWKTSWKIHILLEDDQTNRSQKSPGQATRGDLAGEGWYFFFKKNVGKRMGHEITNLDLLEMGNGITMWWFQISIWIY